MADPISNLGLEIFEILKKTPIKYVEHRGSNRGGVYYIKDNE